MSSRAITLLLVGFGLGPCLGAQQIRLRQSLRELEAAALRDSNDAAAQYAVALGYWSKKRFDDAERALRTAVAIEPRFALGHLALAYLPYARRPKLLVGNRPDQLTDSLRLVLEESSRLQRRAFLIDPLVDLQILGAVFPVGIEENRYNPFGAFLLGDYKSAFQLSDNTMKAYAMVPGYSIPDHVFWFHGLSAAHLGQYTIAVQDMDTLLDRSLRREQSDTGHYIPLLTNDYRYMLALMNQRDHKPVEAITLYKDALAHDLGLFMAHVQMGKIYEARQMWNEAIQEFRDAVATNPDDPSLLMDLGVVLREGGQLTESGDALQWAMAASPRDSRIPYHLGITEQALNRRAQARAAFERFLALAPSRYAPQISEAKQRLASLQ